jgi:anti-sigma B factor antagonist
MFFDITVAEQGDWTVVSVSGEVDVATAPRLREEIVRAVSQGATRILVDLEAVDFLDSMGLGVLVGALKRVKSHGGEMAIVCTNERLLRIFEITGLQQVFDVRNTVDDVVGSSG